MKEEEREGDSLKFHWVENGTCVTRLVFGLNQSPFILEGMLMHILKTLDFLYLQFVEKIKDDMQVNDLVTGSKRVCEVERKRSDLIEPFERGGCRLHKWLSNDPA